MFSTFSFVLLYFLGQYVYKNFVDTTGQRTRLYQKERVLALVSPSPKNYRVHSGNTPHVRRRDGVCYVVGIAGIEASRLFDLLTVLGALN
jgi:hypothetical protein